MGRRTMLVCAAVGVLLLVVGARALPGSGATEPTGPTVVAAPEVTATEPPPATATPTSRPPTSPSTPSAGPSTSPPPRAGERPVSVPGHGPGTYARATVSAPSSARHGRLYRVDVRVEKGLDLDADAVARAIGKTLDDPRSWRSTGHVRFSVVPAGQPADLHAYLVTPGTTDRLCAPLRTRGDVSCRSGDKVVLNALRWVRGAAAYGSDRAEVAAYRQYLVNHEFGHALGHGHVGCPARGRPAPVMLQQTKGLQGCRANPWPSVTHG